MVSFRPFFFGQGYFPSSLRIKGVTVLLAILGAAALSLGWSLDDVGFADLADPAIWVRFLVISIFLYLILSIIWIILEKISGDGRKHKLIDSPLRWRYITCGMALITCTWIVVWLAAWPGFYCYDTGAFREYVQNGVLNGQQSVLHTLIVGTVVKVGLHLFGDSWNAAVALYIGLQAIAVISITYLVLLHLVRRGLGFIGFALIVCFYAFNPLIVVLGLCSTKDILFSALLVYFALKLEENAGKEWSKEGVLKVGLIVFLLIAYRSNALFAFAIFMPIYYFAARKSETTKRRARGTLLGIVVGVVAFLIWNGPVATALSVAPSNPLYQMVSMPAAQLARIASVGLLDSQRAAELGIDAKAMGNSYAAAPKDNTDYYRGYLFPALDQERYEELASLYFDSVMQHPGIAFNASILLTRSLWDCSATPHSYNVIGDSSAAYCYGETETSLFACWVEEPAELDSKIPVLFDALWQISRYDVLQNIPFVALLVSPAAYVWLAVIALCRIYMRRDAQGMTATTLLLSVVLTIFLGPTTLPRYIYYLMLYAPIFVYYLVGLPKAQIRSGQEIKLMPTHAAR